MDWSIYSVKLFLIHIGIVLYNTLKRKKIYSINDNDWEIKQCRELIEEITFYYVS